MKKSPKNTRHRVWNGTVYKTAGGLTKADLMMNSRGRIVSRIKHEQAKRDNRLVKLGYLTRKGKFGFYRNSDTSERVFRRPNGTKKTKKTRKYSKKSKKSKKHSSSSSRQCGINKRVVKSYCRRKVNRK
jgi:hypothetical protein